MTEPGVRPGPAIRKAAPQDVPAAGKICFEAFTRLNAQHNFPPDFPALEVAVGLLAFLFSHPRFYCLVAEDGGRIVGSNCLDERSSQIAGIGPITVDPAAQNKSVGRSLMDAVTARAHERSFSGVRLVQAAFHNRSLSLYAKLGFVVREPLAVMQGKVAGRKFPDIAVRPMQIADLAACNALCEKVHGHDRSGELDDAVQAGTGMVAEQDKRIVAYTSALAFFGHSVAESTRDLQALIASVEQFGGPGVLVPTRNAELFRWCLESGLHMVEPMTLMTTGLYNEPAGAFLPSITF